MHCSYDQITYKVTDCCRGHLSIHCHKSLECAPNSWILSKKSYLHLFTGLFHGWCLWIILEGVEQFKARIHTQCRLVGALCAHVAGNTLHFLVDLEAFCVWGTGCGKCRSCSWTTSSVLGCTASGVGWPAKRSDVMTSHWNVRKSIFDCKVCLKTMYAFSRLTCSRCSISFLYQRRVFRVASYGCSIWSARSTAPMLLLYATTQLGFETAFPRLRTVCMDSSCRVDIM